MDRRAWQATAHRVTKSQTRLSDFTFTYDYTVEVRNRLKGLDLMDRVPEELWTDVCDIVQEEVTRTIPQEKEMQKCKMAVWGGLTNS